MTPPPRPRPRPRFGVRVVDDRTLEYRFTRPAPYFPALAAKWGTIPLRQELIEAGGPDWWANPATRIGNGPFRLVAYDADGSDNAWSMPATTPTGAARQAGRHRVFLHRLGGCGD